MKILQVTSFFKPMWESGGVARVAYEISRHLKDRGHDITVYTTNRSVYPRDIETNKPVDVEGMEVYYFENLRKYFPWKTLPVIPYFLPFVARKQIKEFDIIHVHEHRTLLAVIVHHYAVKHNIPYVLQSHGSVLPFFAKQRFKKLSDSIWGYRILKDASKVIALTDTEAKQYKKMGVDEDKIEIIPNGVSLSEFEKLPEKGEFRKRYSIKNNEKVVLYLGRMHKIKGIDLLVEAFAELAKEMDDIKLVMVGPDGGILSSLKKKIENQKIGERVLFTGPLYDNDKLQAYVDADVYVLPSVYEIFGITALESCACGTPVVVTDQCGISEFLNNTGCVVEYDKEQIRNAIIEIFNNKKLYKKYSINGKKLARDKLNNKKIVKDIEKIYFNIPQDQSI